MDVDILLTMVSQNGGAVRGETAGGRIKLENLSFDATKPCVAGSSVTARSQWSDITFLKAVDLSTPTLIQLMVSGIKIQSAIFSFHKSGGSQEPFFTVTVKEAVVSSYKNLGYGSGDGFLESSDVKPKVLVVREAFTMNFAKIAIDYFPQRTDGTMHANASFEMDIRVQ
jgi:type VI secretion system secreted protein Hcp